MLYLDYAATTPPYDEVIESVAEVMKLHYGNPSSIHRLGVQAERLLERSKQVIAEALHVSEKEIIFTSGGTESNNLAIKGIAYAYRNRGKHLITTMIEHASVAESFALLENDGFRVTYLPVDGNGQACAQDVQAAITEDTVLVSVMFVNNEMGSIQPIGEIGKLLAAYPKIWFHVDAVQAIGKLPVKPRELGIDLCSVSAHKFRGPKGAGFLYSRAGIQLQPQLVGGGQEFGVRSGTENVPLIVGMAKAIRMSMEQLNEKVQHKYKLRTIFTEGIASIPGLLVSGSQKEQDMAPHIVHFTYPGMKAEVIVHALEQEDIYISTKSACASGEEEPSKVLLAMGYDRRRAASGLRISFSETHTAEDAYTFIEKLRLVTERVSPTIKKPAAGRGKMA